jgi:D-3-phosphoglycerate dehydrogenase
MRKKRLVHIEPFADPVAVELLSAADDIELVQVSLSDPEDAYWERLAPALGLQAPSANYVGAERLKQGFVGSAEVIERCPDLLAMTVQGAGYDTVDVDACTAAGVLVLNQTGLGRESVAEHAFAMMIALSKQMIQADRALRRDRSWTRLDYKGSDIHRKTLGIVGLGNIGSLVARMAGSAFSMRVLAHDPYLTEAECAARGAEPRTLEALLAEADFVTVHVPLTRETAGMFGEREFAAMKPGAFFISTSRGGIHDEEALAGALRSGRLAGAGLDVWRPEPPELGSPLLAFDNVFATPHNAGCTVESYRALAEGAARQWLAVLRGRRPPRIVNPEAWPRYRRRAEAVLETAIAAEEEACTEGG